MLSYSTRRKIFRVLYIIFRVLEACGGIAVAVLFVLYSTKNDDRFIVAAGVVGITIAACELALAFRTYFAHRVKKRKESDRWKR